MATKLFERKNIYWLLVQYKKFDLRSIQKKNQNWDLTICYIIYNFPFIYSQMYPNDQSISSYSSNPSTPVNSPPPLTQTPIQNSTPSTSWQQPVMNNSPAPSMNINGIQNGQYAPSEMVHHRGIHMVIIVCIFHLRKCHCVLFFNILFFSSSFKTCISIS